MNLHLPMLAFLLAVVGEGEGSRLQDEELEELIRASAATERDRWWPAVERLGRIAASDEGARAEIWRRARVDSLGIQFVEVEAGTFTMGPDGHRVFDVQPAHRVEITRGYFMSATEVTNAAFRELFPEREPSPFSPHPDSPVTGVAWEEARLFCERLSEREGARYRLPTEAEWEHACRAGTATRFSFGDDPDDLARHGWSGRPREKASRVALLRPNPRGLYDMHGNALEWVSDWYSRGYYAECAAQETVRDPEGPRRGWGHVLRGGGWPAREPLACASAARCPLPLLDYVPGGEDEVPFRQTIGWSAGSVRTTCRASTSTSRMR